MPKPDITEKVSEGTKITSRKKESKGTEVNTSNFEARLPKKIRNGTTVFFNDVARATIRQVFVFLEMQF